MEFWSQADGFVWVVGLRAEGRRVGVCFWLDGLVAHGSIWNAVMYALPAQRRDVWMETELGYEVDGLEVSKQC